MVSFECQLTLLCVNSLWKVFIVYKRFSAAHELRKTVKTRQVNSTCTYFIIQNWYDAEWPQLLWWGLNVSLIFLQRRPAADDDRRQGDNRRQGDDRRQDITIDLESCVLGHSDRRLTDNRQCAGHALRNRCTYVIKYQVCRCTFSIIGKVTKDNSKQNIVSAEEKASPFYEIFISRWWWLR